MRRFELLLARRRIGLLSTLGLKADAILCSLIRKDHSATSAQPLGDQIPIFICLMNELSEVTVTSVINLNIMILPG